MSAFKNLTNLRFDRLVALRPTDTRLNKQIVWLCRCDCGNLIYIRSNNLTTGNTKSCGCLRKEQTSKSVFKHGDSDPKNRLRLYNTWVGMNQRCSDPNHSSYKYYGKRDIAVCNKWKSNYLAFKYWAMSHGYKNNLVIDRINSKGNYEPSNCQWLTASENSIKRNKENRGWIFRENLTLLLYIRI